ncbi:MAG: hypothetical protein CW338_08410, partial [Clostridiales bacterium]|nr:hypothetical protein [Clostridiales bacterium]
MAYYKCTNEGCTEIVPKPGAAYDPGETPFLKPLKHDWSNGNGVCKRPGCGYQCPHDQGWKPDRLNRYLKSSATCKHPATYYMICSVCGAPSNSDEYTIVVGFPDPDCHVRGKQIAGANATCTASGKKPLYECSETDDSRQCDAVMDEDGVTISAAEKSDWGKTPQSKGYIAPLGHDWRNKDGVCARAGCGSKCPHDQGWKDDDTCKICGAFNPDIAAFNAYKAELAQKMEGMRHDDDSADVSSYITSFADDLKSCTYDRSLDLRENIFDLDTIMSDHVNTLETQRAGEVGAHKDAAKKALDSYLETRYGDDVPAFASSYVLA